MDQSTAEYVFQILLARCTSTWMANVNQGFDFEVRFESCYNPGMFIEERVSLHKTIREPRDVLRFVMRGDDCMSETIESISME